jgi:xanthine dehydrogenase accessory factor
MSKYSHEWLEVLHDLCKTETPCVLITVTETKGFTPRDSGTKMIVTEDQLFGTIGGGNLEFDAVNHARNLLQNSMSSLEFKHYALGPSLAQCCGGTVTVLLEPFIGQKEKLYLFGAGHVGKEVVKVLESLPVQIYWIDEREEEFPEAIHKNVQKIISQDPVSEIKTDEEGSYILIMTHSHDLDLELVKKALETKSFKYLGLIGSLTKRKKFEKRLKLNGFSEKDMETLTCPIGIGEVSGKHPREIAISVVAQLLSLGLTQTKEISEVLGDRKAHIS